MAGAGGVQDDAGPIADAASKNGESLADAQVNSGATDAQPPCSGVRMLNLCWYTSDKGDSCTITCADHDGFDARATPLIGSEAQGGDGDNCQAVIAVIVPAAEALQEGARTDGNGVGCHLFGGQENPWWLRNPDFSPDNSLNGSRVICACLQ